MPIQLLPPQLANQIAAGEVVERPASIVKELIENSLDAGATQIVIDIERGGHKRVHIRDNGSGIGKDELALALSRHATSKIATLDDLEAIHSLGFRGEALASISSVSRLTLTSRTENQSEAWQAIAQGRDMAVTLQPAAHPVGTSIDVLDVFFNTPARRKFLRAEKTEFGHIDECIRRIALSRMDVSIVLNHNGKQVRRYQAVKAEQSPLKRIAVACGQRFVDDAIRLDSCQGDLSLTGWLVPSIAQQVGTPQNEKHYAYVNGRMMRDKLIMHALRQAYEGMIPGETLPSFVLFFTLPADLVDVNVHPAKHEVRFHHTREVHDFIYRAVLDVLEQHWQDTHSSPGTEPVERGQRTLATPNSTHDYKQPLVPISQNGSNPSAQVREIAAAALSHGARTNQGGVSQSFSDTASISASASVSQRGRGSAQADARNSAKTPDADPQAFSNYQQLMQSAPEAGVGQHAHITSGPLICGNRWLFSIAQNTNQQTYALDAKVLLQKKFEFALSEETVIKQPLLLPISLPLSDAPDLKANALAMQESLTRSGIVIEVTPSKVIIKQVPAGMRGLAWADLLTAILSKAETHLKTSSEVNFADAKLWICQCLADSEYQQSPETVAGLLNWTRQQYAHTFADNLLEWATPVQLESWLSDVLDHKHD